MAEQAINKSRGAKGRLLHTHWNDKEALGKAGPYERTGGKG